MRSTQIAIFSKISLNWEFPELYRTKVALRKEFFLLTSLCLGSRKRGWILVNFFSTGAVGRSWQEQAGQKKQSNKAPRKGHHA